MLNTLPHTRSNLTILQSFLALLGTAAALHAVVPAVNGLKGDYYANINLTGSPALSRTDPAVNFTWSNGSPGAALPVDKFSARWSGKVESPVTGEVTFFANSDDGVRLWVDGNLLVNNWNDHGPTLDQAVALKLTAGQKYDIQVEYYENGGGATMQLSWMYGTQARVAIPQQALHAETITLEPAPLPVNRAWLSDLPFLSSVNGWGPVERNRSNGETAAGDGKTLTIAGERYSRGLGVHARSEVAFALDDRYDMFRAVIGVDDEAGNQGSVIFEVWLDGKRAYQSPVMRGNMTGRAIEVKVEDAREMRLVVADSGDGVTLDHADWAYARLEGLERIKYLSEMEWNSSTNGNGPVERNEANGGSGAGDGEKIRLRGQTYPKGLGTQAVSEVKVKLNKRYERFSSVLGIDDAANGAGSVIFEIYGDAILLYRSPVLRGSDAVMHVSVPVTDREEMTLKVLNNGDGNTGDLGDWANARLLPAGSDDLPVDPRAAHRLEGHRGRPAGGADLDRLAGRSFVQRVPRP